MRPRYLALDVVRQLRNVRSLVFVFVMPVVMLLIFGSAYGSDHQVDHSTGLPWLVVTTIQMAAYGGMMAGLSQSFTIVNERSLGWNRQLRITPLSGGGYLASKLVGALAVSLAAVVIVALVSALGMGANLAALGWLRMVLAVWLGTVPFALIAILIGQFARPEFAQPLFMVVFLGLSIVGGLWVPLEILPSWVSTVAKGVPSYWLDRVGQLGASGSGSMLQPALVLGAWSLALAALVVWRYRRDSARA